MQQKELAIALGIAQPSVSQWEKQKADPTDENAEKMAELFGVTVSYILCRDQSISDAEYASAARGIIEPPRDAQFPPAVEQLAEMLMALPPEHLQRVRDFLEGLKAAGKA